MSKPKLTPWFDGSVKPIRVGAYERKLSTGDRMFWFWSGSQWDWGAAYTPDDATPDHCPALRQDLPWRGLASDPKETPP